MNKIFRLHFRYRDATNSLEDCLEDCQTTSLVNARAIGKRIAAERGQQYDGKYWLYNVDRPVPKTTLPCGCTHHGILAGCPLHSQQASNVLMTAKEHNAFPEGRFGKV